jgi:Tol biopolymer transport system component
VSRLPLGLLLLGAAACSQPEPSACTADGYPLEDGLALDCSPGPGVIGYAFIPEGRSSPALFLARPDGTCNRRISRDGAFYGPPAFFPGGRKVAYASTRLGLNSLYVLDLASGQETRIDTSWQQEPPPAPPTPLAAAAPRVSPDGRTIAFEGSLPAFPGWSDVFSVPAAGGAVTRLSRDPVAATWPAWSNDGARVFYFSYGAGGEIASTSPDGALVSTPVTTGSRLSSRFTVSGDGTALVYARFAVPDDGTRPTELVARDLATGAERVVSSADEADPAVDAGNGAVAVSRRNAAGGYDLVLLDFASGAPRRQLTSCPGQAFGAAFAR